LVIKSSTKAEFAPVYQISSKSVTYSLSYGDINDRPPSWIVMMHNISS